MAEVYYRSPLGITHIVEDDGFISKVSIRDEEGLEATTTDVAVLNQAIKQLDEYFAGTRREFDLPLKQPGSDFQQEVWQELLRIPYGTTITYGQQSHKMQNPLAIRAIAAANGRNHLWIIVPCHRVIGSNGSLTGYAGGIWRKKWLLEHEARVAGVGQTTLLF
ncbi:methylated-DNA--[protein]-cysteine S-methyltransferase [Mucilaginibacter conchicola]|uniref:Methylated-DNA--protein-cysteine methyltransferase n=1 Tax=Mucilaginibacter conchicola TaxID=2303333 RepID=A0A372NPP1_9SPHI|nr:methylated-DNA--[protein]-cysteine S-methyltransferase [Mucilaginibacter conchicola]RFZ90892.1 methylated-DNA--[protein]-cysteine S-methyltransferase [Mucilaginibacter conchicola]